MKLDEDFQEMLKSAMNNAFNKNLSSLPQDNDAVTSNVLAKKQAIDMAEEEVEEEKGYSPFLKSDENPKGETEGLTVDVLNQILMKIVQDEEGEGGETTEATGAGSAGGFEAPLFAEPKKNTMFQPGTESKLTTKPEGGFVNEEKIEGGEATEATTSSSSGVYDAPFGGPKKDPLKLSNPDTVEK